mmetsp:Transcript_49264/g.71947  ORF Transcript_49264/g.71947 Transcript_49264/m.71947 type:complete len:102 (+) Transcript_49264:1406-1711(+)
MMTKGTATGMGLWRRHSSANWRRCSYALSPAFLLLAYNDNDAYKFYLDTTTTMQLLVDGGFFVLVETVIFSNVTTRRASFVLNILRISKNDHFYILWTLVR